MFTILIEALSFAVLIENAIFTKCNVYERYRGACFSKGFKCMHSSFFILIVICRNAQQTKVYLMFNACTVHKAN